MRDLYLAITVLCFLVVVIVYCVNKAVQALKELHIGWKNYKQSQEEILNFLKENK